MHHTRKLWECKDYIQKNKKIKWFRKFISPCKIPKKSIILMIRIILFNIFPMFPTFIATAAAVMSVLSKVIWKPDQILKNYKLKSTKGLSTKFITLWFITHILWTLHWIFQNDMYLVVWQSLWAVMFGIIIIQIIMYKDNNS